MLELKTKWFTNSLAKQSMLKNDFIPCSNNQRLYVVSYGNLTPSGKNTYNVVLKDSDNKVLEEYSNLYLDAITKLILGSSPKAKENKESETNEANKEAKAKQTNKKMNKECLYLTFDEAFDKACKDIESYKNVAKVLGKYDTRDAINLALYLIKEANESEVQRLKDEKKRANIEALQRTLAIAIESQNNTMIEQIKQMIIIEQSM